MSDVLTINAGSSSIRFALFRPSSPPVRVFEGKMERIGGADVTLTLKHRDRHKPVDIKPPVSSRRDLVDFFLKTLEVQPEFHRCSAIGHRVVHGMRHSKPERVTGKLLTELNRIVPFDPEHLPREIELIRLLRKRHPRLPQVACFDTAFHRTMPRVATQLAIPRRFESQGLRRYGFHGLSYSFLMRELARLKDSSASRGRIILAHLGNGASLAAVRDGRCIDTSMGFTPASGVMMSSRSGDIDPGVLTFLATARRMSPKKLQRLVTHESGLLGVSEISSDVRDLLERESTDERAAEALGLFCYQIKKWLGSFAAALGGLDTLVFAGGIGENSAAVRERVCDDLRFLGINIDKALNRENAPIISTKKSTVNIRVIRTDEEIMIARSTWSMLRKGKS